MRILEEKHLIKFTIWYESVIELLAKAYYGFVTYFCD